MGGSIEVVVEVDDAGSKVRKTISELDDFQIHGLFEIFIIEQFNLYFFKSTEEKETDIINAKQEENLILFNKSIGQIARDKKEAQILLDCNLDDLV